MAWAGATAPDEWLICDGSAISRTTYADLFAILGTTYGAGDGSTTFNIPDLRGSVIIGAGEKVRAYAEAVAFGDIDLGLNALTVADARKYGNAKPLTLSAGAGDVFGVSTGASHGSSSLSMSTAGWIDIGDNPCPNIGDKIVMCAEGNATGIVGIKWVAEINAGRTQFRISNTDGGATVTSSTTDAFNVGWARIEDDNTDGESAQTSWSQTGDTWSLGGNSMPEIGDRILCTYESSTSPNRGSIYTVSIIDHNGGFYTGNLGSDSGTVRWINLGPEPTQPQDPTLDYWGVYVDDTHLGLATSFEDAINGVYLNFNTQGTAEITVELDETLTDRTLGAEGGHEKNNINVAEMPAHTHTLEGDQDAANGPANISFRADSTGESKESSSKGGSEQQVLMPPFVTLNWIIKT